MPNPQPGGPGYPFLSGSSPLTCLAGEALPVVYATASIALGIMWPHKPLHSVKGGIPLGGICSHITLKSVHIFMKLEYLFLPFLLADWSVMRIPNFCFVSSINWWSKVLLAHHL
jgi:hypothetical protein